MANKDNIAVLGAGNLGYSIAKGLVKAGVYEANQITLTRRNMDKIAQHKEEGFKVTTYNKSTENCGSNNTWSSFTFSTKGNSSRNRN